MPSTAYRTLFALAVIIGVVFVISCVGCEAAADGPKDAPAPSADPVTPATATVGQPAPQIDAADFTGRTFRLTESRGRVVVVTFWGTWCGPCNSLIPHERQLVKRHADELFTLIGVAVDENPADASAFVLANKILWRNLPDAPTHAISDAYIVKALPTTFVIDKAGVLRNRFVGARPAEVEAAVKALLAAK